MFGRLVGALVAILGLPVHALIAACIRAADGGPALYRSVRLGMHGKPFSMLKYRSMVPNAPAVVGRDNKTLILERDPRMTIWAPVLRSGIDELPQLFNIVRGEMAWVGPRPDEVWMAPKYGPVTNERLKARPGITGLAQVLDSRNLPTAVGYALDVWWTSHRSFLLNLWVVMVTPLYILGWRSVGNRRRRSLLHSPEVITLVAACEAELEPAPEIVLEGKHG